MDDHVKVDCTLEENGKFGAASKVSIPTRQIMVAPAEPHHRVQVLDRAREFQPAVVASAENSCRSQSGDLDTRRGSYRACRGY